MKLIGASFTAARSQERHRFGSAKQERVDDFLHRLAAILLEARASELAGSAIELVVGDPLERRDRAGRHTLGIGDEIRPNRIHGGPSLHQGRSRTPARERDREGAGRIAQRRIPDRRSCGDRRSRARVSSVHATPAGTAPPASWPPRRPGRCRWRRRRTWSISRIEKIPETESRVMAHTGLVLQGGGALGAFECGALLRLYEDPAFSPDVIAGVSIGAINAVSLVGAKNDPLETLRLIWDRFTVRAPWFVPRQAQRFCALFGNPSFFSMRHDYLGSAFWTSFYTTDPLRRLLHETIDFDKLNDSPTTLVISATNLKTGDVENF